VLLTTMETPSAVTALSALAHPGRLEVFRLLVRAGPDGMAAGDIARATGSLANTLSANLNLLAGAGLVTSRREGRSIIYAAGYDRMRELLAFLMEDCCGGNSDICAPLAAIAERAACCA
jgi:ArsR family transcriptional regulator